MQPRPPAAYATPLPQTPPFTRPMLVLVWVLNLLITPIIGLVMFLVWREREPTKARQAGIAALVGFVFQTVMIAVLGILAAVLIPQLLAARTSANERAIQSYARQVLTSAMAHQAETMQAPTTDDCTNGYSAGNYSVAPLEGLQRSMISGCQITADANGTLSITVTTTTGQTYTY